MSNTKHTSARQILKTMYYKGKDGEGLSDYELDQALAQLLALLEGEVIGEDEVFIDIPIVDHRGKEIDRINNKSYTPIMLGRNHLRAEQRDCLKKLMGNTGDVV